MNLVWETWQRVLGKGLEMKRRIGAVVQQANESETTGGRRHFEGEG